MSIRVCFDLVYLFAHNKKAKVTELYQGYWFTDKFIIVFPFFYDYFNMLGCIFLLQNINLNMLTWNLLVETPAERIGL